MANLPCSGRRAELAYRLAYRLAKRLAYCIAKRLAKRPSTKTPAIEDGGRLGSGL